MDSSENNTTTMSPELELTSSPEPEPALTTTPIPEPKTTPNPHVAINIPNELGTNGCNITTFQKNGITHYKYIENGREIVMFQVNGITYYKYIDENGRKMLTFKKNGITFDVAQPGWCDNLCECFCTLLGILCILGIVSAPLFLDLYFAYKSKSCQHHSTNLNMTLSTWLQVDGFVYISKVVVILLINRNWERERVFRFPRPFPLFFVIWTIIGCVMFWDELDRYNICAPGVTKYMYSKLIISLFLSWGMMCNCCIRFSQ